MLLHCNFNKCQNGVKKIQQLINEAIGSMKFDINEVMEIKKKTFKKEKLDTSTEQLSLLLTSSQRIAEAALLDAEKTDFIKSFPHKTLSLLRSTRLLVASVPSKYGGSNLGLLPGTNLALLTVLKNVGRGNLVVGRLLEGHINAQLLINKFGSKEQKNRFAKDASAGRLFGVWNTQADDGTFLIRNKDGHYVLKGSKTFATGADYITRPIVTAAKKDGSWQMCVVPLDKASIRMDSSWWNPMGMKSSRSFKITFQKTEIKKNDLLGSAGEYYHEPGFSGGAVRFAAVQLGAAEQLLDETRKYLVSLNRTEDPFQKMRLGQMAIAVESGNQWLVATSVQMDLYMKNQTKSGAENFVIYANMMRTAIEKICTDVINLCQKSVGARGLNKPYHFERIIRDLSTYLRQPAPDAILADVGSYVASANGFSANIWNVNFKKKEKR